MTPSAGPSASQQNASGQQEQTSATQNQNQVASNNSQLNGAIQNTGYYQNQVQAGTNATTQGYDASARNLKSSMEAAGVQGNSGVAAGNATALGAQEANALGQVKTNAYSDTENQQLAANSQALTASGQQQGAATNYENMYNNDQEAATQQGWKNQAALGQAITTAALA